MILKSQLLAARASALATVTALDASLAVLDSAQPVDTPLPEPSSVSCEHPVEKRIPAGRFGALGAWICGVCNHHGGD